MFNLFKAINYQIKKNNLTYIVFLLAVVITAIPFVNSDAGAIQDLNAGLFYVNFLQPQIFVFMVFNVLMVTGICGFDMKDKTINYEIMTGHSRKAVYFSRVLMALSWSVLGMVVVTAIPFVILSVISGWGKEVLFSEFLIRSIVFLFQAIRLFCFEILLTFLIRSQLATAILSYFIMDVPVMIGMVFEEFFDIELHYIFAFYDMMHLSETMNGRNLILDGVEVYRYELALQPGFAMSSIATSVIVSAIYVIVGYVVFCKRDMR